MRSSNMDEVLPPPKPARDARRDREATSRSCSAWARNGAIISNRGGARSSPRPSPTCSGWSQLAGELLGLEPFSALECTLRRGALHRLPGGRRRDRRAAAAPGGEPAGAAREAGAVTGAEAIALADGGPLQPRHAQGRRRHHRQLRLHAERPAGRARDPGAVRGRRAGRGGQPPACGWARPSPPAATSWTSRVVRYGDHRLYLKSIAGGMLCIVSAGAVNMPALRMAANLVGRRIAPAVARAQVRAAAAVGRARRAVRRAERRRRSRERSRLPGCAGFAAAKWISLHPMRLR